MKKILILLLLFVAFNSNAEVFTVTTECVSVDLGKGPGTCYPKDIDITIDSDQGIILFNTQTTQIYTIVKKLPKRDVIGYDLFEFDVMNNVGKSALLQMWINDRTGSTIRVIFKDCAIDYHLKN